MQCPLGYFDHFFFCGEEQRIAKAKTAMQALV
jgi:hypothetical protein